MFSKVSRRIPGVSRVAHAFRPTITRGQKSSSASSEYSTTVTAYSSYSTSLSSLQTPPSSRPVTSSYHASSTNSEAAETITIQDRQRLMESDMSEIDRMSAAAEFKQNVKIILAHLKKLISLAEEPVVMSSQQHLPISTETERTLASLTELRSHFKTMLATYNDLVHKQKAIDKILLKLRDFSSRVLDSAGNHTSILRYNMQLQYELEAARDSVEITAMTDFTKTIMLFAVHIYQALEMYANLHLLFSKFIANINSATNLPQAPIILPPLSFLNTRLNSIPDSSSPPSSPEGLTSSTTTPTSASSQKNKFN